MDELSPKREIKQGRRAGNLFQGNQPTTSTNSSTIESPERSPKPARRQGGWADSQDKKRGEVDENNTNITNVNNFNGTQDENNKPAWRKGKDDDDERLRQDNNTILLDNDVDDIPVIPDLDEVQGDDMTTTVAAPPSVQVTRVATYKELDHEFEKHSGLLSLDGDIDLKLLGSVLSPESDVLEEDKVWEWDRIFTEVSSDLRTEWEMSKKSQDK